MTRCWLSSKEFACNADEVPSLGQKEPLEKEMVTHLSILVWETPWTEKPGALQSMGSQKSQTQLSGQTTTITAMYSIQCNKNDILSLLSSSPKPTTRVLPWEKHKTNSNSGASYQKKNPLICVSSPIEKPWGLLVNVLKMSCSLTHVPFVLSCVVMEICSFLVGGSGYVSMQACPSFPFASPCE